jgi:flavin reductase (DIM6/NTAB) family NADH-FMN oxidoreductase RutF/NifU-like protein involved in Fe-S cluster formation
MSDFFEAGVVSVPSNFGPLRDADGNARVTGPCGDTMEFWISVIDGVVDDARYTSDGCMASNACGSLAAILARGRTPTEVENISQEEILSRARGIPESDRHCALLASNAIQAAVADYRRRNFASLRSGEKRAANARSIVQPRPSLIVSCRGTDGRDNALVVAYGSNCSYDPCAVMVGIVPTRFSYRLIKESGCFVVNIPSIHQRALYDYLGSHSGRDGDKLAVAGARCVDGDVVRAPLLVDCPVNIECVVTDSIVAGSHELFIGKIQKVHADSELVSDDGSVDWNKISLLQ